MRPTLALVALALALPACASDPPPRVISLEEVERRRAAQAAADEANARHRAEYEARNPAARASRLRRETEEAPQPAARRTSLSARALAGQIQATLDATPLDHVLSQLPDDMPPPSLGRSGENRTFTYDLGDGSLVLTFRPRRGFGLVLYMIDVRD